MSDISGYLLELIRLAATDLPSDVEVALREAMTVEQEGSAAQGALKTVLENISISRVESTPVCQDTGTPIFFVTMPLGESSQKMRRQIEEAIAEATRRSWLRPNAVHALTDKNTGNNVGDQYFPAIYFREGESGVLTVDLMLKGGGSENVCTQYALPDEHLHAGRDLDGVRKCVLHAVQKAQGQGCSPGILGVAVGGDRGSGYAVSKEVLLRKLTDVNPEPRLAELEQRITTEANQLGIGPMGFGGKTTVLATKIKVLHRLPACYYVTVSYMCWACRRRRLTLKDGIAHFDLEEVRQ